MAPEWPKIRAFNLKAAEEEERRHREEELAQFFLENKFEDIVARRRWMKLKSAPVHWPAELVRKHVHPCHVLTSAVIEQYKAIHKVWILVAKEETADSLEFVVYAATMHDSKSLGRDRLATACRAIRHRIELALLVLQPPTEQRAIVFDVAPGSIVTFRAPPPGSRATLPSPHASTPYKANWRSVDVSTSVKQGIHKGLNHELALLQYKVGRHDMSITFGALLLKDIRNEPATLADVGTRRDALNGQQRIITSFSDSAGYQNKAIRADVASLQSDKDKAITDLKSAANDNIWLAYLLKGKGYNIDVTLFVNEKTHQVRELARLQNAAAAHLVQRHKDGIADTHLSYDRSDDAARALERGAVERMCKDILEKMKRFADQKFSFNEFMSERTKIEIERAELDKRLLPHKAHESELREQIYTLVDAKYDDIDSTMVTFINTAFADGERIGRDIGFKAGFRMKRTLEELELSGGNVPISICEPWIQVAVDEAAAMSLEATRTKPNSMPTSYDQACAILKKDVVKQ
ncbi:hypothetical protein J4E93_006378 [Alternaria ventricosa]|uniref:uncharacterized protein n=1 Tax=Alternaria ventricosa TaxID=1187951 RepID=UPI0020C291AD|nr:uncharacterized protein J4E93_006378 [Alternaria ventricosa]KAI4644475.1 hypothetical protein J4E93_006378 [Alternaria ventricosa]